MVTGSYIYLYIYIVSKTFFPIRYKISQFDYFSRSEDDKPTLSPMHLFYD